MFELGPASAVLCCHLFARVAKYDQLVIVGAPAISSFMYSVGEKKNGVKLHQKPERFKPFSGSKNPQVSVSRLFSLQDLEDLLDHKSHF